MIRIRYLLVLVAIFLFGSCAESILEMEQEDDVFYSTRSGNSSLDAALAYLKETRLGGPLWEAASSRLHHNMEIRFVYDPSIRRRSMKYMGEGRIVYNSDGMSEDDFLQLTFHELFHMIQPSVNYKRSWNDEIEAYLAQYIFLVSLGHGNRFDAGALTQVIKDLARNINMSTGETTHPRYFRAYYDTALRVIKTIPLYQNREGEIPWVEESHRDIIALANFLKNIK